MSKHRPDPNAIHLPIVGGASALTRALSQKALAEEAAALRSNSIPLSNNKRQLRAQADQILMEAMLRPLLNNDGEDIEPESVAETLVNNYGFQMMAQYFYPSPFTQAEGEKLYNEVLERINQKKGEFLKDGIIETMGDGFALTQKGKIALQSIKSPITERSIS